MSVNDFDGYLKTSPSLRGVAVFLSRLVSEGNSINSENNRGGTLLFYALYRERLDVAEMLIQMGANINCLPDGNPLTHCMLQMKKFEALKLLIRYGAKIDVMFLDKVARTGDKKFLLWLKAEMPNVLFDIIDPYEARDTYINQSKKENKPVNPEIVYFLTPTLQYSVLSALKKDKKLKDHKEDYPFQTRRLVYFSEASERILSGLKQGDILLSDLKKIILHIVDYRNTFAEDRKTLFELAVESRKLEYVIALVEDGCPIRNINISIERASKLGCHDIAQYLARTKQENINHLAKVIAIEELKVDMSKAGILAKRQDLYVNEVNTNTLPGNTVSTAKLQEIRGLLQL